MKFSTLSSIVSAHAKVATIAVVAAGATAGGGLAVATNVANTHATSALTTHSSSVNDNGPDGTQTPDGDQSSSPTDTSSSGTDLAAGLVTPSPTCPSGLANHGAYVSSVAKTKPTASASPGSHGALVSAAAQSDCGKPSPEPSSSESSDDQGTPTATPSHPTHPSHPTAPPTTSHSGGQSSAHPNHGH